jgi:hypothetical protein
MDIARVRSVKKNRRESPRVPIPLSQSKFIAHWRVSHREKKISADSANGSNRQAAKQFGHLPMRKRWHRIHDTESGSKTNH